jgi:hypothetical protein
MDIYRLLLIAQHPVFQPLRSVLRLSNPTYRIWTDASGQGYGGHLGGIKRPIALFQQKRLDTLILRPPSPESTIKLDYEKPRIELHEAAALYLCLHHWQPLLKGSQIEAHMDNRSVCEVYQGHTDGTEETAKIVEAIKEFAKAEGMKMNLTWISGEDNRLADGLSRYISPENDRYSRRARRLMETGMEKEKEAMALVKKITSSNSITPST